MVLPVVSLPPVMDRSVETGYSLFDKPCEFRRFQNDLTRLTVLEGLSMVNIFAYPPTLPIQRTLRAFVMMLPGVQKRTSVFSCGHRQTHGGAIGRAERG
jgi:hypothetical protein